MNSIPQTDKPHKMNPRTTRYKYHGIILIRYTAKRGGVRCGACGKRIRRDTQCTSPESVWWMNGHPIVCGHEECVRRIIRKAREAVSE